MAVSGMVTVRSIRSLPEHPHLNVVGSDGKGPPACGSIEAYGRLMPLSSMHQTLSIFFGILRMVTNMLSAPDRSRCR